MQTWALIVDSFRDAIDRKIFWIMIVISAAIAAAMACISFDDTGVNIMFGAWHIEAERYAIGSEGARELVSAIVVKYICDLYMGWGGIILALVATAGMVPAMMAAGSVDVLVSKPLSRIRLFLGKYAGALVFVLLQSVVFVALTFLVVGIRWHHWIWGYLWLIPLTVLLFSYLYAFCALFGVLTRSALAALLLTIVVWVAIWTPQTAYEAILAFEDSFDSGPRVKRVVGTVRWILPKTQDIPLIAGELVDAALLIDVFGTESLSVEGDGAIESFDPRKAEEELSDVNIAASIGSSLAFEAVIVGLAAFLFRRKDF